MDEDNKKLGTHHVAEPYLFQKAFELSSRRLSKLLRAGT
jgi:hypothetical protein